jgi:hypothetical protein
VEYPGYVEWLSDGIREFPNFVFSADTDMATNGFLSLTSTSENKIILASVNNEEYSGGEIGIAAAVERICSMLGRSDFATVSIARIEGSSSKAPIGAGFQEFLKAYKTPVVIYKSIFEEGLEAKVIWQQEPSEFISEGGRIEWARS